MPARKRLSTRARRRRGMRRSRRPIRRRRMRRGRRRGASTVYHTKFRTQLDATIGNTLDSGGAPAVTSGEITFRIDQMPHITSYARLFNQYKIRKVKLEFVPTHNRDVAAQLVSSLGSPQVQTTNAPTFVTWLRRAGDTAAVPTSLNQALSIPYSRATNAGKFHKHYFTPSVLRETYRAPPAITNAYAPMKSQWLSTLNQDVIHYGVRYLMSEGGTSVPGNAYQYRIVQTMYVSFRGKKADYTV